MNKSEKDLRKDKKNKDRLSLSIFGVVLYSALLVIVMAGSYIGVKMIFKNYDNMQQAVIEEQEDQPEETIEEIVEEEEPAEEFVEELEKEPGILDHTMDISEVVDSETGYIDYSTIVFKPAKRDRSLKWNDTVFSRIENVADPAQSLVNTYMLKRVSARLSDQKSVEYKAYYNPDNNNVEKITETVNCGAEYEVINYYYDEGKLNYVSSDKMIISKPVPLSSASIESRYYFNNDVLVKFIFCDGGTATEYSVANLREYSDGTVDQYDFLEDEMINRAYIVYNLATELNDTEEIYGYILDEFSMPIEDADVTITNDNNGKVVSRTQTDGDGYYKAIIADDVDSTYTVSAHKDTLGDVSVYGVTAYKGAAKYCVDPIYMNYTQNGAVYNVAIMVRDAFDNSKALSEATIKLRRGINNKEGDVIATGMLDVSGMVTVPMSAGSYTAEVSLGGYETTYFPVIVRVDHVAAIGFAVPDVPADSYAVVLSWESSPLDLDIRAIATNQSKIIKSSVDSIGSTSAESVILDNAKKDSYRIYVSDCASIVNRDPLSYNMTGSVAQIYVYSADGQIASMHVPVASAGDVWEACEIFGGRVLPVNNYYYSLDDDPIWTQK